ncbi:hypothetical protein ABW19_dt0204763 [Dactylella cylindrospora]|nr:hypothetical protein ABW19_dt0204763 [Dactylella cylindrospora]
MKTDKEHSGAQVAFDDAAIKAERKKNKKKSKSSKPEVYHHTPTFAAQSFTLTTTPEVYKKKKTHKLSRPVLEQVRTGHVGLPLRSPTVQVTDDSSSDCDRASLKTPTNDNPRRSPGFAPNRFSTIANPHYELFSSAILHQPSPAHNGRAQTPTMDSFTRGRPDWSEMDEKIAMEKGNGLRRMASVASTKSTSSKSHRSRRHSVDLVSVLKGNTVVRVPNDDESIYQGRGCVPWRHRIHS